MLQIYYCSINSSLFKSLLDYKTIYLCEVIRRLFNLVRWFMQNLCSQYLPQDAHKYWIHLDFSTVKFYLL